MARFIELALYHPTSGYYRTARSPFGKAGDFYTAEQLQPVFGDLIASYVADLANASAFKEAYSVLEIGSGRGDMGAALSPWNYRGLDWHDSSLPARFRGLVLTNEFFDALPVHLLVKQSGGWRELGVASKEGRLELVTLAQTTEGLLDYAQRYGSALPEGSRLEVCLDAAVWVEKISRIHEAGTLLVIDYGYSESELVQLLEGTMMTYRQHHASSDFLTNPGQRDITTHVNFSYLRELAIHHGYQVEAEVPLRSWITRVWNENQLESLWRKKDDRWKLQWKQLFTGMGEVFRVLELTRKEGQ